MTTQFEETASTKALTLAKTEITTQVGESTQTLNISEANITCLIRERHIVVCQRLTFHNPHNRENEAEFIFPLPPTATVCAYGTQAPRTTDMLCSSRVGNCARRVAFMDEERFGNDKTATLVEHAPAQGNVNRTRLSPVPLVGTYTVEIRYTNTLFGGSINFDGSVPQSLQSQNEDFWECCSLLSKP
mmetsp:Transcript_46921/g.56746  ORF Transcript_46921/g.56746 Transcript_46921/m.56746 type:complete len:187 (-) Transcript_46921:15-575(-)